MSLTGEQEISAVSGRVGIYAFLGWKWGRKEEHGMLWHKRKKSATQDKKSPAQNLASLIVFFKNMEHIANSKLFSLQHSQNYDLIEWHTPKWRGLPSSPHLFFKVGTTVQVAQHGKILVTSAKVTSKKRDRDFNSMIKTRHCRAHVKVTLLVTWSEDLPTDTGGDTGIYS